MLSYMLYFLFLNIEFAMEIFSEYGPYSFNELLIAIC